MSKFFNLESTRRRSATILRIKLTNKVQSFRQSTPIVERIGERITNQAGFDAAIERAKSLTPDGGTCPAAALERSLGMIMANDLVERPYKVGIMMTDGVWYDPGKSTRVSRGFASREFIYRHLFV